MFANRSHVKYEFTNTIKLVKRLAGIETSSICRQQFASMFANCLWRLLSLCTAACTTWRDLLCRNIQQPKSCQSCIVARITWRGYFCSHIHRTQHDLGFSCQSCTARATWHVYFWPNPYFLNDPFTFGRKHSSHTSVFISLHSSLQYFK